MAPGGHIASPPAWQKVALPVVAMVEILVVAGELVPMEVLGVVKCVLSTRFVLMLIVQAAVVNAGINLQ
jgi:hypothetical protein